jgi:hypothetical protein
MELNGAGEQEYRQAIQEDQEWIARLCSHFHFVVLLKSCVEQEISNVVESAPSRFWRGS